MFTRKFLVASTERAAKSVAQALIGLFTLSQSGPFNVLDVDVKLALGVAAGAAVLSYLTSVISAATTDKETPSLTPGAETPSTPDAV